MITLQHSLVTLFGLRGDEEKFDDEIAYTLIPDAIRRYTKSRQYSHFEEHPTRKDDIAYMAYPEDLKGIGEDILEKVNHYMADDIPACKLGERSHIETFEKYNQHLSPKYFAGVKKHLTQDIVFDDFIRENIDCSRKFEDKYVFHGKEFDGNGIRDKIAEIENQGLYVLAFMVHEAYGITANQEWFDKHVKDILDKEYSKEMKESTYNYMKIPTEINERITNHDWSHIHDGEISCKDYMKMYEEAIEKMPEIDRERKDKENNLQKQNSRKVEPKKAVISLEER